MAASAKEIDEERLKREHELDLKIAAIREREAQRKKRFEEVEADKQNAGGGASPKAVQSRPSGAAPFSRRGGGGRGKPQQQHLPPQNDRLHPSSTSSYTEHDLRDKLRSNQKTPENRANQTKKMRGRGGNLVNGGGGTPPTHVPMSPDPVDVERLERNRQADGRWRREWDAGKPTDSPPAKAKQPANVRSPRKPQSPGTISKEEPTKRLPMHERLGVRTATTNIHAENTSTTTPVTPAAGHGADDKKAGHPSASKRRGKGKPMNEERQSADDVVSPIPAASPPTRFSMKISLNDTTGERTVVTRGLAEESKLSVEKTETDLVQPASVKEDKRRRPQRRGRRRAAPKAAQESGKANSKDNGTDDEWEDCEDESTLETVSFDINSPQIRFVSQDTDVAHEHFTTKNDGSFEAEKISDGTANASAAEIGENNTEKKETTENHVEEGKLATLVKTPRTSETGDASDSTIASVDVQPAAITCTSTVSMERIEQEMIKQMAENIDAVEAKLAAADEADAEIDALLANDDAQHETGDDTGVSNL